MTSRSESMFALDKHIVLRESDELARSDVLAQLRPARRELGPAALGQPQRGQRPGRVVGAGPLAQRPVAGQQDDELLEAGVVADDHRPLDRVGQPAQAVEQLARPRPVQLLLDLDVHVVAELDADQLQRLPRAGGGRAEDEVGADLLLAQVHGEAARRLPSARGQRPVAVGLAVRRPARLGVAEQRDLPHGAPGLRVGVAVAVGVAVGVGVRVGVGVGVAVGVAVGVGVGVGLGVGLGVGSRTVSRWLAGQPPFQHRLTTWSPGEASLGMVTCWLTLPCTSAWNAPSVSGSLWSWIDPTWLAGRWLALSVIESPGRAVVTDRLKPGVCCCPLSQSAIAMAATPASRARPPRTHGHRLRPGPGGGAYGSASAYVWRR